MAGKRNKNGRYITRNLTIKAPETVPASSPRSIFISLYENTIVNILASAIFAIFLVWLGYYLTTRKTVEADLTLKEYRYERETPKYRVYAVNFTINNSGNQDVTLIQAIPYDPNDKSSTLNFLQNNSCESFKDVTIEGGKLKDFTMHVFVPKETIAFAKILEKNMSNQLLIDPQTGERIKPIFSASRFYIIAKVLIHGADKHLGAVSAPFEMLYSNGEEISNPIENSPKMLPKPVGFEVRDKYFYNCPVKNITE